MVIILIPSLVLFFKQIKSHYTSVSHQLARDTFHQKIDFEQKSYPVIVPISGIHPGVVKAIQYALTMSNKVTVVYVDVDKTATEKMLKVWEKWGHGLELVVVSSPYRSVLNPLLDYIDNELNKHPDDFLSVVVPEFVTKRWYHQFLHNQMTFVIRTMLRLKPRVVVTSIRYHL